VLTLVGLGTYHPETCLTDETVQALTGTTKPNFIRTQARYSVQPLELLQENHNRDLKRSIAGSFISVSEMGERAAREAIERAGILPEQVGLVMAESLTPVETTPAESQRVAGRLGIKVPAYDITSGLGVLPWQLSILTRWRLERLPEYLICVATNAPTQRIQFGAGVEPWVFGDGAAAAVFTTKPSKGLSVIHSETFVQSKVPSRATIDTLGFLTLPQHDLERAKEQGQKIRAVCEQLNITPTVVCFSEARSDFHEVICGNFSGRMMNGADLNGDLLGADPLTVVANSVEKLSSGDIILAIVASGYAQYGFSLLRLER
jgi:3-oxoacyl-[acyl-carrier-protein] synthase III